MVEGINSVKVFLDTLESLLNMFFTMENVAKDLLIEIYLK